MEFLTLTPLTVLPVLLFPTSTFAAPSSDLSKRSYGKITLWSDSYYRGSDQWCEIIGAGTSVTACQPMAAYMNDQTSSYQIYNGCCTLYTDGNCQGQSNHHCSGPGGTCYLGDLAGSGFNDRYSSFKCSSQY